MKIQRFFILLGILLLSLAMVALTLGAARQASAATDLQETLKRQTLSSTAKSPPTLENFLVFTSTNLSPILIPETACGTYLVDSINVPLDYQIVNVSVGLAIEHTDRNQIHAYLRAPDGITTVDLVFNPPNPLDANLNVLFDLELGGPQEPGSHNLPPPYYSTIWQAMGNLALFQGMSTLGPWEIWICDINPLSDMGSLHKWSLFFEAIPNQPMMNTSYVIAPAKIQYGDPIEYTFVLRNDGLLPASNVIFSNPLPPGSHYITNSLTCPFVSAVFSCTYSAEPLGPIILGYGLIDPGGEVSVTYQVDTPLMGYIANTAILSATELVESLTLATNGYIVPQIYHLWDFELDNGGFASNTPPGEWQWGSAASYPYPFHSGPWVWGTNLGGPYNPSTTSILTRTVDLGAIDPTYGLVLQWWEWYDIADLDSAVFTINGIPVYTPPAGTLNNWEHRAFDLSAYAGQVVTLNWILTSNGDNFTGAGWYLDDVSIHSTILEAPADLDIGQIDHPDPVMAGGLLTYTLTVTNLGNFSTTGVTIHDYLPSGVAYLTAAPDPAACSLVGDNLVSCDVGYLDVGDSCQINLLVAIDADLPGIEIVNLAQVTSASLDPNPTNNQAIAQTQIIAAPLSGPRILGVLPEYGVNTTPTPIMIVGRNFTTSTVAYLGALLLTDTVYVDPQTLQATVPTGLNPGTYRMRVVNPDGQFNVRLSAFTVLEDTPPTIAQIRPAGGLNDLPVLIDIFGSNFSPNMTGWLSDGITNQIDLDYIHFINFGHLRAIVPADTPVGLYSLTLYSPLSGQSNTLAGAYRSFDPLTYDDLAAYDFDLWLGPPAPMTSEVITAGLEVRRIGGTEVLSNVVVSFTLNGDFLGTGIIDTLSPRSRAAATLSWPTPVTPGFYDIVATIDPQNLIPEANEENNVITRTIYVRPFIDENPPTILTFTLNGGVPLTNDRQITLDVEAQGNPAWLYYIEYIFNQNANTWMPVAQSGWLTYTEAYSGYPWVLQPIPGTHVIQVWAATAAGSVTPLPARAGINLAPDSAFISRLEGHVYRIQISAGETVLARLTSLNGDADLYIWGPGGLEIGRSETGDPVEEIRFTAPLSGVYQIEVEGYTSAWYRIQVLRLGFFSAPPPVETILEAEPEGRGRDQPFTVLPPPDKVGLPPVPQAPTLQTTLLPTIMRLP